MFVVFFAGAEVFFFWAEHRARALGSGAQAPLAVAGKAHRAGRTATKLKEEPRARGRATKLQEEARARGRATRLQEEAPRKKLGPRKLRRGRRATRLQEEAGRGRRATRPLEEGLTAVAEQQAGRSWAPPAVAVTPP